MQLDQVEAQPRAAQRRIDERLLDAPEAHRVERHRRVPFGVEGDRRRRIGRPRQVRRIGLGERPAALPRPLGRGLAAGMGELDAELDVRRPAPRPLDDRLYRRFVVVAVKAEAALGDATLALDMRGLEAEQAGARHRQHAVMHLVPGPGAAVDRRVLAHRRHDDAVGQRDAADFDGREKLGSHDCPSAALLSHDRSAGLVAQPFLDQAGDNRGAA
jgi:hypothetical protein